MNAVADARAYPARPFLAVSAAIVREGKFLLVRRARPPASGLYSIEPVALAGFRETIARDGERRVERHFVILCFAARWLAGEPVLNEELSEARWIAPAELAGLPTTPGLAEIVADALAHLASPA